MPYINRFVFKWIVISILLFAVYMVSANFGGRFKFIIGVVGYFSAGLCAFRTSTSKQKRIILCLLLPLLIPIAIHVFDFHRSLVSIPITMAPLAAFFLGLWAAKSNIRMVFSGFIVACLCVFFYTTGFYYWKNYLTWGSINGVTKSSVKPFTITELNGTVHRVGENAEVLYVLDFWTVICAPCFESFPEWADLLKKYEGRSDIAFFAVNLPIPKQKKEVLEASLKKYVRVDIHPAYFPSGAVMRMDRELGIAAVPTTLIIKGNSIVYKGNLQEAKAYLKSLNY